MLVLTYAHRYALGFIATGCALGALCGYAYDKLRNRRTAGE